MMRRGTLLVEVIALVAVGMILVMLIGQVVLDATALQRRGAEHANRVAVTEHLYRQLWDDVSAARSFSVDDAGLMLSGFDPPPGPEPLPAPPAGRPAAAPVTSRPAEVRWTFAENVARREAGGASRAWSVPRLTFAWRVERGPRRALLRLEFVEHPPKQRREAGPRTFVHALELPPEGAPGEPR